MNPVTGQFLGPNTTLAIGTHRAEHRQPDQRPVPSPARASPRPTYKWPRSALAPRFGMAYDLTGKQRIVLRGGAGLFFDRPSGNSVFAQVLNPPNLQQRHRALRPAADARQRRPDDRSAAGAERLRVRQRRCPSSMQWNGGVQMALPWATALDVAYVGQHSYNILADHEHQRVDFGAAFLPQNQDPTLAASTTPGATAVVDRPDARASAATARSPRPSGWQERTYHSLQLSLQRRFRNGLSFGFNDTIGLYDRQNTDAAPAAQRGRHVLGPGRSGGGRRAARRQQPAGAHHQGATSSGTCRTCTARRRR